MTRRHCSAILRVGMLILLLAGGTAFAGAPAASVPAEPAASPAPAVTPVSKAAKAAAAASARANAPIPAVPMSDAKTAAVAPAAPAAPGAAPETAQEYRLPTVKKDPFKPFLEMDQILMRKKQEERQKKVAAKGRPISPLQQAEIGQLRLVGIAGDDRKRTAIVEDRKTKRFYPLSVGTYIGPNEGRVAEILADRVVVVERSATPDKRKKTQTKRIPLFLRPEP